MSLTQQPWFLSCASAYLNPAAITPHCPISAAHCLQEQSCHRGCPGPPKSGTSHHPCNLAQAHRAGPPSSALHLPYCSWGARAAEVGWTCTGSGAGQSAQHAQLTLLMSLPADELEQFLQDGQKYVRARHSLSEGLSWGPFRGSIQNRASSPGQAEPVRSPSHRQTAHQLQESSQGHSSPRAQAPLNPASQAWVRFQPRSSHHSMSDVGIGTRRGRRG